MNIPETFYIALCVTILLLGAIYWFWTQLQYLQRKVNLLDNVVYEMKTLVSNLPPGGGGGGAAPPAEHPVPSFNANTEYPVPGDEAPPVYEPPPESEAGDLEAERMASEMEFEQFAAPAPASEVEMKVTETFGEVELADDLQPGGLAMAADTKKSVSDASIESPLSGMSIKELRRMAEANGIPGASDMKKKDLVRALRDKVSTIVNNGGAKEESPKVLSFDDIAAPDGE
jgi:hypothetical protein